MSEPNIQNQKRVLIVTGEASGDLHAANLIRAAREKDPGLSFFGVTGPKMRDAGCETLLPYDQISVMGLVEVLGRLPAIRQAFKAVTATFTDHRRPDLLVLVDFPGFNMRLAKVAKKAGIPVLYYIAPKVWAWRQSRAKKLAETVDRMAVIFPFEPEFYAPYGLKADYVGNPLLDDYAKSVSQAQTTGHQYGEGTFVGLFPGSRRSEIKYNLEVILQTAQLLLKKHQQLRFLLPLASSLERGPVEASILASGLPIEIVESDIYGVAAACSAALAVSGTVTLQIALAGTPMAVMYRAASITAAIGRRVVKIPHFSLVNIVAGREIVREFIQEQASPEALTAELSKIIDNPEYNLKMSHELLAVKSMLGTGGCSNRVAQIVMEMLCG